MTTFQKIRGDWRLWWGFCPECNSDAPALDTCLVCDGYSSGSPGYVYPPMPMRKAIWRRRFLQRCLHNRPLEADCPDCNSWLSGIRHPK